MGDLRLRFRAFFTAGLGRCGTCMRQSLAAALAMWGLFGIGLLVLPASLARDLVGLLALALTALWMLHVVAYAVRTTAQWRSGGERRPSPGISKTAPARTQRSVDPIDRRDALGVLLRAAGVGAVASVPVFLWPSDALAFCGQCTKDEDCGVGFVCKNTAPVNADVCNECVKS